MARGNWNIKHGGSRRSGRLPEYGVWHKMLVRCRNPRSPDFKNYGGRGITVCDRWQDFASFFADMGSRPTPSHTIERVNNNAGYSPENCIWATRAIQNKNKRPRARKTHCQHGHLMIGENIYIRPDNGKRGCRKCRQKNMRDFYNRQREAA